MRRACLLVVRPGWLTASQHGCCQSVRGSSWPPACTIPVPGTRADELLLEMTQVQASNPGRVFRIAVRVQEDNSYLGE